MNKNIDLGTFQWDTTKIEHQIAANTMEMQRFATVIKSTKDHIKEQSKEMAALEQKIESERKAQERLRIEFEKGYRSQESYNLELQKSNEAIDQFTAEQNKSAKAQADAIIKQNQLQQATKDLRLENNELNKLMSAGRSELSQNESAYRELNKELNALKTEAKNLGAQMLLLESQGKQGTDEYKKLATQFVETSQKANELNDKFKTLDHSVGDNQRSVGDYKDQIVNAWNEIGDKVKSGDLKGAFESAKDGVGSLKDGVGSLFKLLASNPWIIAVAGVALFVKEMFNYNSAIRENVILTENLFDRAGDKSTEYLDKVRNNIQGLADTYDVSFKEIAMAVDDLVDTGAAKDELEALAIIKDNIVKAPDGNEFISTLGETAIQAEQAGMKIREIISAKQSLDASGGNNAFFSAIQKGYKSLNEGSDKLKITLTDAFGSAFSTEILAKVQGGAMTTIQALEEIRKKGEQVGLSEGDRMNLAIQLFGKSALAAGGYAKVMNTVRDASEGAIEPLTPMQEKMRDLITINQELAIAKDEAFKSDSVMAFQKDVDIMWKKIKIWFFKGLGDLVSNTKKEIDIIRLIFMNVSDFIKVIPQAFGAVMKGIIGDFKQLASIASAVGLVLRNVFTFNVDALGGSIDALLSRVKNFKSETTISVKAIGNISSNINAKNDSFIKKANAASAAQQKAENDAVAAAENKIANGATGAENSATEAQRKQSLANTKKYETQRISDAKKAAEEQRKLIEQEAKRTLDIARETANQQTDIAKTELAEYIAANADKLKDEKRLNEEKVRLQKEYFAEVQRQQEEINALEENAKIFAVQQKIDEINQKSSLNQNDLAERRNLEIEVENIKKEFAVKNIELQNQTNENIKQIDKTFADQKSEDEKTKRAIDFEQKLIDLEENNATEYELNQVQLDEQKANDLAKLEEDRANELISLQNYEAQKKLIEQQTAIAQREITEAETRSRLDAYAEMFGGVAELLGKHTAAGKAAGIAQATINTYQGVSDVWKTPSTLPEPFATASKVVSTGVVLASGLSAVRQITSVKTPKAARGMLIQGPSHNQGGVPISTSNGMIEAEGGEVIINKNSSRLFGGLLSAINVAGGGVPLYANGGLVGSNLATVQSSIKSNSGNITISDEAIQAIANAVYSGSQTGIVDLSENRIIANGANF